MPTPSKDFSIGLSLAWLIFSVFIRPWAELIPLDWVLIFTCANAVGFIIAVKCASMNRSKKWENWSFFWLLITAAGIVHGLSLLNYPLTN